MTGSKMPRTQTFAAGRLLMAGLPGPRLDETTERLIRDFEVAHFILFKRNFEDPTQLKKLCNDLRETCLRHGLPAPLIAIDQEGGTVARLPSPFSQFGDARNISSADDPRQSARQFARTCARELLSVGINMNLAPVLDVCPVGQGCVMERRCLSDKAAEVAELGGIIIREMQQNGLAACAKHFPGLGCVTLDPHRDLPTVGKKAADLFAEDLLPFQEARDNEVAAVMTSHTVYTDLDPSLPATLSPAILTEILRQRLSYDGLVITDDLEMGAIETRQSVAEAAFEAFSAGADLLLICQRQDRIEEACGRLQRAWQNHELSEERLAASLARIERVRERFAESSSPPDSFIAPQQRDFSCNPVDFSG